MRRLGTMAAMAVLWAAGAAHAATPEQKCQGGKNRVAGKYAACRQNAEKSLALHGDATKYAGTIGKCEAKFAADWQKEETRAAASGATCLDAPLTATDFKAAVDANADSIAAALAGGGLANCPAALSTCSGDLSACGADLSTCDGGLATCSAGLATCTANYGSCSASLTTCSAGTASGADVLVGKTFSSSAGIGATGTMPSNGAVSIMPGTAPQVIPAGHHNGAGSVAGDADLTPSNVRLGVTLFGVAGTLGCGNGAIDADAGEQCDQSDLGGASCASQGFAFGTLRCGPNCAFDSSACYAVRFTDNGDGTISDAQTGLMWEKKGALDGVPVVCANAAACPDPHDADNQYTYSFDNPLGPPGTAFTVLLAQLNAGGGFAGHTDWRLPTRAELQSLADYGDASAPVVAGAFDAGCSSACAATTCSCTAAGIYWSSELTASISGNAWVLDFADGSLLTDTRDTDYAVRAVR